MTDPFGGDVEAAELYAARLREWGKWEAASEIFHGGARSANEGDKLPTSVVEELGYARQGLARLQHAWVAEHPDDPDVKTFLAWAKDRPEHPLVTAWESYRSQRADTDAAAAADNPFGDAPTSAAARRPARAARKATAAAAAADKATADKATAAAADKE